MIWAETSVFWSPLGRGYSHQLQKWCQPRSSTESCSWSGRATAQTTTALITDRDAHLQQQSFQAWFRRSFRTVLAQCPHQVLAGLARHPNCVLPVPAQHRKVPEGTGVWYWKKCWNYHAVGDSTWVFLGRSEGGACGYTCLYTWISIPKGFQVHVVCWECGGGKEDWWPQISLWWVVLLTQFQDGIWQVRLSDGFRTLFWCSLKHRLSW